MLPGVNNYLISEYFSVLAEDDGGSSNMAVVGTLETPVIFRALFPTEVHSVRLMTSMFLFNGGKVNDPAQFVSIPEIANGMVIGRITHDKDGNEVLTTSFIIKNNYDMMLNFKNLRPSAFTGDAKDVMVGEIFADLHPEITPREMRGIFVATQDDLSGLDSIQLKIRGYAR